MGQEWARDWENCAQCTGGDSEKNKKKIEALEEALRNQAVQKQDMKKKLQQHRQQMKEYKRKHRGKDDDAIKRKIQQLKNEKKTVFNNLLSERRNASKLEDEIEKKKLQMKEMEHKLNILENKKKQAHKGSHLQTTAPKKYFPQISVSSADNDDDFDDESDEFEDESDESQGVITTASTRVADDEFNVKEDAQNIHSWLDKKINWSKRQSIVTLKTNLADLLTERSHTYRADLAKEYKEIYHHELERDIKKILNKGKVVDMIHGLLMTGAQYDAVLIHEYVQDWDIMPTADIICCRTMEQLRDLNVAYKKKCKGNIRKQLQGLAKRENKNTLIKVIGNILDFERKEDVDVDLAKVNTDLEFVLSMKNFKGKNKQRLILIFTANSVQYIKVFRDQFAIKSKDSLTVFIDKKLGPNSTAGYFCKTRIRYALSPPQYFAEKVESLGQAFKWPQKKIADVFIQRMEIDLDLIQYIWKTNKLGDGKEMKDWVTNKMGNSMAGYFMMRMLENCHRYTPVRKEEGKKKRSKFEEMMMGKM